MSHKLFFVSDTNPNDTTGGGGCVCSPEKSADCKAPFVICPGNDMENIASPHVVIGASCVAAMFDQIHGEVLQAGEDGEVTDAEVVNVDDIEI